MSAKDAVRRNKTGIQEVLCSDFSLILNKVHEKNLITRREYNNLKNISGANVEQHVIEVVDKIMDKGEETCQAFLDLLQTDENIKTTYPDLKTLQLSYSRPLSRPVQASSAESHDALPPDSKRRKEDGQYQLNSRPTGLCVIMNNENFMNSDKRRGSSKDAQSLAEVFSWLGFRVLMFKDQTKDQMDQTLGCFASDLAQLQVFDFEEWSSSGFTRPQEALKHGDAFICCILSHGQKGVVLGIDGKPLPIKQITRTFKGTDQSALTGKPKVFLIQACQGPQIQCGVLSQDLQVDDLTASYIPVEADVLVASATVEDYKALRHIIDGSWFVQSVCRQLQDGCSKGEDIVTILHRVNDEVSQKEGSREPGTVKQMPEVRFTLRKRLVLSPHHN